MRNSHFDIIFPHNPTTLYDPTEESDHPINLFSDIGGLNPPDREAQFGDNQINEENNQPNGIIPGYRMFQDEYSNFGNRIIILNAPENHSTHYSIYLNSFNNEQNINDITTGIHPQGHGLVPNVYFDYSIASYERTTKFSSTEYLNYEEFESNEEDQSNFINGKAFSVTYQNQVFSGMIYDSTIQTNQIQNVGIFDLGNQAAIDQA